jgi:hypothetical protein
MPTVRPQLRRRAVPTRSISPELAAIMDSTVLADDEALPTRRHKKAIRQLVARCRGTVPTGSSRGWSARAKCGSSGFPDTRWLRGLLFSTGEWNAFKVPPSVGRWVPPRVGTFVTKSVHPYPQPNSLILFSFIPFRDVLLEI